MAEPQAGLAAAHRALSSLGPASSGHPEALESLRGALAKLLDWGCAACEDDLVDAIDRMIARLPELTEDDARRADALAALTVDLTSLEQSYAQEAGGPPVGGPSPDAATAADDASMGAPVPNEDLQLVREFVQEARSLLEPLCATPKTIDAAFVAARAPDIYAALRTISGLAALIGFSAIVELAGPMQKALAVSASTGRPSLCAQPKLAFDVLLAMSTAVGDIADALAAGNAIDALPRPLTIAPELQTALRQLTGPEPLAGAPGGDAISRHGRSSTRKDNIRVEAERLDRLVDAVGELVITETMLRSLGEEELGITDNDDVGRHLVRMAKIIRELQELSGSLRMVPVRATFRKMSRLARDVAKKSGRQVDFVVVGEEVELDKSLVDRIGDPLVHMIRNAIDHGLEPDAAARIAAGKPPAGRVELRALHRGGNIYIEVQDDGRGIDAEKIREKAIARGLISATDELSQRDLLRLICEPGLSTAASVTAISGRGVGMDVVKQNIMAMGGTLEIASEPGVGTTFSMQLPLTLAVIDGLVVRLGAERYIVPTLTVVRLIQASEHKTY